MMARYRVSFGPRNRRCEALFTSYTNALKFFNDCVEAGRTQLMLESPIEEVGEPIVQTPDRS